MSSLAERECYQLFRVWKTLREMCNDRGYLVNPEMLELTFEGFQKRFAPEGGVPARKDLTFLVQHNEDESNRLYVFFPDMPTVDSEDVGSYCEKMQAGRVMRGIIAVQKKITPMAVQGILAMAPKYILERFQESELMFNITKHHLVPLHILLKEEEKQIVLDRYKLSEAQMPRIQESDPIARYYGLTEGQVLKIVRKSETAGRYVTYRICYKDVSYK
eukprot:m.603480 g.603480  ORF g.603480 m.603480 type:complete len:217 (-) comp22454_c1_seq2:1799-2449(-)